MTHGIKMKHYTHTQYNNDECKNKEEEEQVKDRKK